MGKQLADLAAALDAAVKPAATKTVTEVVEEAMSGGALVGTSHDGAKLGVAAAAVAGLEDPSAAEVNRGALCLTWSTEHGDVVYRTARATGSGNCDVSMELSFDSHDDAVTAMKVVLDALAAIKAAAIKAALVDTPEVE